MAKDWYTSWDDENDEVRFEQAKSFRKDRDRSDDDIPVTFKTNKHGQIEIDIPNTAKPKEEEAE